MGRATQDKTSILRKTYNASVACVEVNEENENDEISDKQDNQENNSFYEENSKEFED